MRHGLASQLAAGARVPLMALACGMAALTAIELGLIEAARTGLASAAWQLDELLFAILTALLGAVLADAFLPRDRRRGRAADTLRPIETAAQDAVSIGHFQPRQLRRVFERRLATIAVCPREICVVAISFDRFREAQRTLGDAFAARLMRRLRERLEADGSALLIESLGADTLGLLLAGGDLRAAVRAAETILADPTAEDSFDDLLTMGAAGPATPDRLRETIEQAQSALDEARRSGKRLVLFDAREKGRRERNIWLMFELQKAISCDALELHYQPKMASRSGEIDSVEALIRWRHPEQGAISPGEFVPIAEASGDVEALTLWVVGRAIRDWDRLDALGIGVPIYVNISAQLVGAGAFAKRLLSLLAGYDGRIGIEITETAVLSNPEEALANLRSIAEAGISIAIDDYGVGLSSLSYLKQLPATELKIDMTFITHLADSHRDPMIVRSTIDLAHGLGLRVTAEGVDKLESLTLLKIMGCDLIQGHQIAAAMPLAALERFLEEHDSSIEHVPDCAAELMALVARG